MRVEMFLDICVINGRPISIYSMLLEPSGLLLGCGAWDRKKQEHSMAVKNATPGMVIRVDWRGKIVAETPALENIVYPLVRLPGGRYFVGCRTGAGYVMDENLSTRRIGTFGGGVYGITYSQALDRLLLGGRDGTLFSLRPDGELQNHWPTPANRLWNLCLDRQDSRFVWASSYNGALYKLDARNGEIVWSCDFGPGATTLIGWLKNSWLAVGSLKKKILPLDAGGQIFKTLPAEGGVCFLEDLSGMNAFYAADHDGRIWLVDYTGKTIARFTEDVAKNNPIWIAQQLVPGKIIFAWANGIIRTLTY